MAVWTSPSHVTTGLASSDQFNDETVENLIYLYDQYALIAQPVACRVRNYGGVAVPAMTDTVIPMEVNPYNEPSSGGLHPGGGGFADQLTIPISGFYQFIGQQYWAQDTDGTRRMKIRRNGTADLCCTQGEGLGVTDIETPLNCSGEAFFEAGEYVQMVGWNDVTGHTPPLLTRCWMTGRMVRLPPA